MGSAAVRRVLPRRRAALRVIAAGNPMPWGEFGVALAGTVIFTMIGLGYLTWILPVFRSRGYLTRYC